MPHNPIAAGDLARFPFALEQAGLAAWPALEQQHLNGWCLRYTNGYTKRANSVNAVTEVQTLTPHELGRIEGFYSARAAPCIFRLVSAGVAPQVDQFLADRGYRFVDPSIVLTRPLLKLDQVSVPNEQQELAQWLQHYMAITGAPLQGQMLHQQLLQLIQGPKYLALAMQAQQPVACALGVMHGGLLGLFDVATAADFRGQGHARALCQQLMAWGQAQGAEQAFLQVTASNEAAIRLYESMGFRRSYQYGYRIQP